MKPANGDLMADPPATPGLARYNLQHLGNCHGPWGMAMALGDVQVS